MRVNSLGFRLFSVAAIWGVIVLVIAAILLSSLYRQTVERRFERELALYLNTLVAVVEFDDTDRLASRPDLQDPRFQTFLTGWYWLIMRPTADGQSVVFPSLSLANETLAVPNATDIPYDLDFRRSFRLSDPIDQPLLAVERQILIDDRLATFLVAGSLDDVTVDVAEFERVLFLSLGLFGAGFLIGTFAVVWLGLRPLAAISRALGDIRDGRAEKLEGRFPSEIEPLAQEVNALIAANRDIVERARTHVGNLAHALKTPLSVLTNDAASSDDALAHVVRDQTAAMREQIDYYLKRARVAAASAVIGAAHPVDETLDALGRTLLKINQDRTIDLSREGENDVQFRGEKQDFEEIAGNLFENAFKWAKGRVHVSVETGLETPTHRSAFALTIEDDGPGIAPAQRETALKRGQRLDERTPGSGLGLSIVADLVALYGGSITLNESDLGGLSVQVVLPRAVSS